MRDHASSGVLSHWTLAQITAHHRLSNAEGMKCVAQLDRIGLIEMHPLNRCRLKLVKTFRWRPQRRRRRRSGGARSAGP